MSAIGDDVLYVGKWPWMDEGGEYKWWEFMSRPTMSYEEMLLVQRKSLFAKNVAMMNSQSSLTVTHSGNEVSGIQAFGVTPYFETMQNLEIFEGRYFNDAELNSGQKEVVIGNEVYKNLFPNNEDFQSKFIQVNGMRLLVIGVLKKVGDNMAGFNFDRAIVIPFKAMAAIAPISGPNAGNDLMVQVKPNVPIDELSDEVEGILRAERRLSPGDKNNFSINRLSQITERIQSVFVMVDLVGGVIAFFSLLVGGFGIANIMFVSVKERTKIIGLKKAIGAKSSSILTEFLIEAVVLCIMGGIIGMVVVFFLSMVIMLTMDFPIVFSLKNFLIGISISTFVGLLSGFIPAISASRLDPVVAIRSV